MYDNNIIYCQTVTELCIWYIYDNNIIYHQTVSELCITYTYHNAQNKPILSLREIGHSFLTFSFNKLHYLGTVILNTTISTMTKIQSTVKRTGSELYNDITIMLKIE
jgi:hypothetical protein